jgi:PKHD-type hydroxylase
MSHKPIWYMREIPPELCDMAVADFLSVSPADANMGQNGETKNHAQRDTTVRFIPSGHWFGYLMHGVAREANLISRWQFDINGQENIQFAEYSIDQHYDWHVDVFPLADTGIDRKVSVVCLLSDPSEFEGGELEVKLYAEYKAPLKKGTIIAFPSILQHRVTPVTSGLRRSATVWMTGPRFK